MVLSKNAGEIQYYSLPELYSSSLTIVSYLSNDEKCGGSFKDLFSPAYISLNEPNGLDSMLENFLHQYFCDEKVAPENRIEFLLNEGYTVAPIFVDKDGVYCGVESGGNLREVGGIISSRGNEQEQAMMLAKELNGEPFVFSILYENTKNTKDDLSHPLYAVVDINEVTEAAEQIMLRESKELVKRDWRTLEKMTCECKKNCWVEATMQNPLAFSLAPDDVRGNYYSIMTAAQKTKSPKAIIDCAIATSKGLEKACEALLNKRLISFDEIPKNLQEKTAFAKYNAAPWKVPTKSQSQIHGFGLER